MPPREPRPSPGSGARARERARRRRRRLGLTAVALMVTGAAVLAGLLTRGDPRRPGSTSMPSSAPIESLDLSGLPIERGPFCDALEDDDVEDALAAPVATARQFDSGQRAPLTAGVRDLTHEYGCMFTAATGARARVWVFAAPVTPRLATTIAREVRRERGCAPLTAAPTYGRPSGSTVCPAATAPGREVTLRGLFGDAWLSCQLTSASREPAPETVRRADQWCVRVATTLGARP